MRAVFRHIGHKGRQIVKAVVEVGALGTLTAEENFAATGFGVFDLFFDFLALGADMDRPHAGFLAHAVADGLLFQDFHQAADEIVGDRFLQEQPLHAQAHLAAVKIAADVGHLHGQIDIGCLP